MELKSTLVGMLALLTSLVLGGIVDRCVTEKKNALRGCANSLLRTIGESSDIHTLVCSSRGLPDLKCIHGYLSQCPDLQADNHLEAVLTDSVIQDLVATTSADNFCLCHNVAGVAGHLQEHRLAVVDMRSPFVFPNVPYICGPARNYLRLAGKSVMQCKTLVQLRHTNITDSHTRTIQKMGGFADRHCGKYNKDFEAESKCVMRRSKDYGYKRCVMMAQTYRELFDRTCGESRCIFMNMELCKEHWRRFYVDAINVFRSSPVPLKQCYPSSAAVVKASFLFAVAMVTASVVFRS